jgi:hypothetical protein
VLSVRILERVRELDARTWDALVGDGGSPFVEHAWLDSLEEAGCVGERRGWLPRHFALHRGDQLIAVAPAYAKAHSEGEFVFDWSWADVAARIGVEYYPKLLFAVPFTPATGERVLVRAGEDRALCVRAIAQAARQWAAGLGLSSTHVLFPREAECAEWEAAGFARRLGVQFHFKNPGYASWEEFLGTFNSKRRHQLKREAAQPAKDGVTIRTLEPKDLTPQMIEAMYAFYLATVDKFVWGRRYLNEKFFRLVAERFSHRLAWVVAEKDGVPIAGAFNVTKGKTLYGRYWGARPGLNLPFLHFNVCYYHGIRECIARGLTLFEPGAGGEHKLPRGFEPTITYSAHYIEDERLRGIIEAHLERERAAIEAHVRSGEED